MYGTSLPTYTNNRDKTSRTLAWYMYYIEIARLMSFQGCGTIPPPPKNNLNECPPAPKANMEMEIWNGLKASTPENATNNNVIFINNI